MDPYALKETQRRNLQAVGAFLRAEFGEGISAPVPDSGGAEAFRFDVQAGERTLRLWVTWGFLWEVKDVAAWLGRERVSQKLQESGHTGSVALIARGGMGEPLRLEAVASADRMPKDLLPE